MKKLILFTLCLVMTGCEVRPAYYQSVPVQPVYVAPAPVYVEPAPALIISPVVVVGPRFHHEHRHYR